MISPTTQRPRVAIIGRANVGKSTLFNRLTSSTAALISPSAGTTRDRNERVCSWRGAACILIDTGGLDVDPHDTLDKKIAEQARRALADAEAILFVVDARAGIMPADAEIAKLLRSIKKPVVVVANKVDNDRTASAVPDFFKLGLGNPWPVSAVNGRGTGDLLDELNELCPFAEITDVPSVSVAIVGRPNVGKSSLFNALLNDERSTVHHEPHTTRDALSASLRFGETELLLTDTAGIRKKRKIDARSLERDSIEQAKRYARESDVVIFVTEAHQPLLAQDKKLAALIADSNASIVIVGNKWDLVSEKSTRPEIEHYYRIELQFIEWSPLILLSAARGSGLDPLLSAVVRVHAERERTVVDSALNRFLKATIKKQPPAIGMGTRRPYLYAIEQRGVRPPQFAIQIDAKSRLKPAYLRYLERELRRKFGFEGTPIKMWIERDRR